MNHSQICVHSDEGTTCIVQRSIQAKFKKKLKMFSSDKDKDLQTVIAIG